MAANMKVHYSSESDEWETPASLWDPLNDEFDFNFDLCATAKNTKCNDWTNDIELFAANYGDEIFGTYWMNPPYSRGKLKHCLKWAKYISDIGNIVVSLIPSRTDTQAWHTYVWDKNKHKPRENVELRLIKGRIIFEKDGKPILNKKGKPQPSPFPSAIVIFRGK